MRSEESKVFPGKLKAVDCDFVLPDCPEPLKEHAPLKMSWAEAIRHFAPTREYYMRHFDSPEKRLREKNPERFRMP